MHYMFCPAIMFETKNSPDLLFGNQKHKDQYYYKHTIMATPQRLDSLRRKVAIVTGAGGGLGREYALALAAYGARVVVNDYGGGVDGSRGSIDRARAVADEITARGGIAIPDAHDVSVETDVQALVALATREWGAVHILVNNAGVLGSLSTHDKFNVASFRKVWEVSVLGTMLLISRVYPIMQKQNYGRIINTASDGIYGLGIGGDSAYPSSKGAVFAMTRDIGRFSPQHGIKINGVLPSAVSRMTDLSPTIKPLSHKYFPTAAVAPFVCALASDECPVSGELFSVGAYRAARTTLATFPGHSNASNAEDYIANFDRVMGDTADIYVPTGCMDQVSYTIRNATGIDLGNLSASSDAKILQ
jgi:NAD(P)-dependent dehydrogenase (short-subunit alcohol dehydrogenase family)